MRQLSEITINHKTYELVDRVAREKAEELVSAWIEAHPTEVDAMLRAAAQSTYDSEFQTFKTTTNQSIANLVASVEDLNRRIPTTGG